LFDVQASRLVSAAFSVSLDGDEITFIADEPVDFAYKGVDHMAEAWARYKAMTLPRRMVAVGRSRRGTRPSRVAELRQAMLANLENQGVADWDPSAEVGEAAEAIAIATPPPVVAPPPPPAPLPPPPPTAAAPVVPAVDEPPTPVEPQPPAEVQSIPIRPGPGVVARPKASPRPAPEVDPTDIFQPEPAVAGVPESIEMEPVDDLEAVPAEMSEPELEPLQVHEPAADLEPASDLEPAAELEPEPATAPEVPELVRELLDTSSDDDHEETPKRLVVDLGAFEVPPAPDPEPVVAPPEPRQPALAATAPVPDKSGIFGAVRAAFVRNKGSHIHEFVEAPGGIGIHRNICNECGYISIGVSESESE
jgi:hypothetical protein